MNIFDRIDIRARRKSALYDLHPELTQRVPILRISSDDVAGSLDTGYSAMSAYYTANPWVHKAIKVVADNLSALPARVVTGQGREAEPVDGHPLTQLLDMPNTEMSGADLVREWVISMMLGGEHGWEAVRGQSRRTFVELWPREPNIFSVLPGAMGRRYRRVQGYKIDDGAADPYTVPPDEFIHHKFFNPLVVWRGLAPITAIRMSIQIDQLSQAWTRLFFSNQARPDFAIIAPEGITRTERDEIYSELDQRVGGDQVHRPIILENGITDIKPFSFPPKDLEWVAQREMSRDEIGAVFGVPDEIMGYGRDTYENFATAETVLWTLTIVPLAGLKDDTITRWGRRVGLLKPTERVETDLSDVSALQEDVSAKIEQLNTLAGRGYPVNVLDEYLGLGIGSVQGGDVGYLPLGMVPVAQLSSAADVRSFPAQPKTKALAPEYGSLAHQALWQFKQARLNDYVATIQRIAKREFQRQQTEIDLALRDSKTYGRGRFKADEQVPPPEELFDVEAEARKWQDAMSDIIRKAIAALGLAALVEVFGDDGAERVGFDVERPDVAAGVRYVLETVARKVNDTTWLDLIGIFNQAESEGLGISAIQELLRSYFGDRKSDWQTERIARTTMTGANNYAGSEAMKQAEQALAVVAEKTWISALIPDRTRDAHAGAHGQTRRMNEAYTVDGENLMFPGDPSGSPGNIINCLCTETYSVME